MAASRSLSLGAGGRRYKAGVPSRGRDHREDGHQIGDSSTSISMAVQWRGTDRHSFERLLHGGAERCESAIPSAGRLRESPRHPLHRHGAGNAPAASQKAACDQSPSTR
jgi:hypothetical protein